MKAAGIIVEYNPFHNGHFYHLQETKKHSNAEVIVAVMSGYFLQRGEPALVDKWTRTKMALQNGADIVVELPYAFATQKAEIFAGGAVSILDSLFVSELVFGSEEGKIDPFLNTVTLLDDQRAEYDSLVKEYIHKGHSYPKSTSLAFQELKGTNHCADLSQPNNILGYHYVKAIHDQNSSIKPETVLRTKAGYHDAEFSDASIASATSIRKKLLFEKEPIGSVESYLPERSFIHLKHFIKQYQFLHGWNRLFPYLKYRLLTAGRQELSAVYEAEEGLENRLVECVRTAASFEEFMEHVKTKRYTWTRLQRLCVHVLTNARKSDMSPALETGKASYIKLLGMSKSGQEYLGTIKKRSRLPIISNQNQYEDPFIQLDRKAADCYALGFPEHFRKEWLQKEYTTSPIRYDEINRKFQ
ncbi:nucleotidyltransferase [Pseudalkalibacillus caeni]|uniref:tRNA(Met) cytidine acetate ligase n=1 Tax=Exobacillus caeni TaxID=2574798 RepID=A0A5R9FAS4_9BACL|nr:nucleotidyltransferase [Pseudalkalibacillus caeni]TLS37644.1 nucleotidyltransferase [Pseudalkalibacillus caeni]